MQGYKLSVNKNVFNLRLNILPDENTLSNGGILCHRTAAFISSDTFTIVVNTKIFTVSSVIVVYAAIKYKTAIFSLSRW